MSTQHRSAPLQAQKGAMRHTEERLCTEKTVPFWVVGFQKRFLERIQGFFQTSQNFQDAAPEVECLHFDTANPQKSSLVVERTYSKEGAGARSSSVHVHFNDLRFEKMGTADRAGNSADKATVFRLLQRLTEHGVVRRLGLHERAAYFTLLIPGKHSDYLICTSCGSIEPVKAPCPVHALEDEIREKTGFRNLYHELEFFGVCPKCA